MSEFFSNSRKIVTDFLQNVVIIDDEAFLDEATLSLTEEETFKTAAGLKTVGRSTPMNETSMILGEISKLKNSARLNVALAKNYLLHIDNQNLEELKQGNTYFSLLLEILHATLILDTNIPMEIEELKALYKVLKEAEVTSTKLVEEMKKLSNIEDQQHTVNIKELSDGFMQHGLMCSVIRPSQTDKDFVNKSIAALKKADIIILDWNINIDGKGSDQTVQDLITKIVEDDEDHKQKAMRYIAIYSGEDSLDEKLITIKALLDPLLHMEGEFKNTYQLYYHHLQINIYAKKSQRTQSNVGIVISENALVDKILNDFTELIYGLVPNMALQSLADIRNNTHRLLANFTRDLDSAYLAHRAMLPEPKDAELLMIDILISEIQSILEDSEKVFEVLGGTGIKKWVDNILTDEQLKSLFFDPEEISHNKESGQKALRNDYAVPYSINLKVEGELLAKVNEIFETEKINLREYVCEIFEKNICTSSKESLKHIRSTPTKISKYFSKDPSKCDESDTKFAILSTIKTRYSNPTPYMTQGTIFKDESENFYVCIVPRCDAARVDKDKWSFPCLPLSPDVSKFDVVIEHNMSFKKFKIVDDTFNLCNLIFKKTEEISNNNIPLKAKKDVSGQYFFETTDSKKYFWVSNLKSEKAQNIANAFAMKLSRVGFNESEYLRRSYQKKPCV